LTDADRVRAAGTALEVGGLSVAAVDGGGAVTEPSSDGSVLVTLTVPAAGPAGDTAGGAEGRADPVAALATPPGGTFELLEDGTVLVRDAAGAAVAGLTPSAPGAVALLGDAELTLAAPDLLHVLPRTAAAAAGTLTLWLGAGTITSADWGDREGGRSLAVVPTAWARAAGVAGREKGWSDLVALVPDADSPTMRDQFVCHAIGAPDKASWNLEPWRPDVGLLGTLAAQCNA
jgi:hypothetical protein